MKRLFYRSALFLAMSFFVGCAQHDPDSPDTSGAVPKDNPNVGVDTVSSQYGTGEQTMPTTDSANQQSGSSTDTSKSGNQ